MTDRHAGGAEKYMLTKQFFYSDSHDVKRFKQAVGNKICQAAGSFPHSCYITL